MAIVSIKIPKSADEKLSSLMAHMNLERSIVLRIALSKGVFHFEKDPPELTEKDEGRAIPINTLCPGSNLLIIKHCLIHKLKNKLDSEDTLEKLIRRSLIFGIDLMYKEVQSLSEMDNYLIFLVENLGNTETLNNDETSRVLSLLGIE